MVLMLYEPGHDLDAAPIAGLVASRSSIRVAAGHFGFLQEMEEYHGRIVRAG